MLKNRVSTCPLNASYIRRFRVTPAADMTTSPYKSLRSGPCWTSRVCRRPHLVQTPMGHSRCADGQRKSYHDNYTDVPSPDILGDKPKSATELLITQTDGQLLPDYD